MRSLIRKVLFMRAASCLALGVLVGASSPAWCNSDDLARAERGDTGAMVRLAETLSSRTPPDLIGACNWARRAAESSNLDGMYLIGACHMMGQGAEQNTGLATTWLKRAAERGHQQSQAALAVIYSDSRFGAKNTKLSYFWQRQAGARPAPGSLAARAGAIEDLLAQHEIAKAAQAAEALEREGHDRSKVPAILHALIVWNYDVKCTAFGLMPALDEMLRVARNFCPLHSAQPGLCNGYYQDRQQEYQRLLLVSFPCTGERMANR